MISGMKKNFRKLLITYEIQDKVIIQSFSEESLTKDS